MPNPTGPPGQTAYGQVPVSYGQTPPSSGYRMTRQPSSRATAAQHQEGRQQQLQHQDSRAQLPRVNSQQQIHQPQYLAEHGRTTSRRGQQSQQGVQSSRAGENELGEGSNASQRERERCAGPGEKEKEIKYVVYLKLPFPRSGFIDPPQVDWDGSKERKLWRILSSSTRNQGIDWNRLAQQFQVSRAFLLQQAAWLYERELSQVRAQMRKGMLGGAAAAAFALSSNSPTPGGIGASSPQGATPRPFSPVPMGMGGIVGGTRMVRTNSGGSYDQRTYASLLVRTTVPPQQTKQLQQEGSGAPMAASRPAAQPMSRTPSTATARPSSQASFQPPGRFTNPLTPTLTHQQHQQHLQHQHHHHHHHILQHSVTAKQNASEINPTFSDPGDGDDDHSSTDEDSAAELSISKRGTGARSRSTGGDGEIFSEDDDDVFLPFSRPTADSSSVEEAPGTATLTNVRKRSERFSPKEKDRDGSGGTPMLAQAGTANTVTRNTTTKMSRADSMNQRRMSSTSTAPRQGTPPTPSLNRQTGRKLPSGTLAASGSGGAESSPSMGSSFSDLSDASVSQSAMEDAYLSNMHTAGMASRMSVFGHAMRSKYFGQQ